MGSGRRTYDAHRDKFDEQGSGEYFVNIGLFINDKIASAALEVMTLASEVGNEIPEMRGKDSSEVYNEHKHIIPKLKALRLRFGFLINMTKGHIKKTRSKQDKETLSLITLCLAYSTKPLDERFNIMKYCSLIFQYFDMLVIKGIIPITAGFTDESGTSKLFRQ